MLSHTDGEATNQVDDQNQQASDRVTGYEFGSTVHGAEEVRLLREFFAAFLGGFLVNHASIQVSVNRHLFSRHGVQGKTCVHFRHTASTFGHHNEVDDHQNREDDETHHIVAANHKLTEGRHHFASSFVAFMAIDQNDTGRRHVQAQTEHGGEQQHRREG